LHNEIKSNRIGISIQSSNNNTIIGNSITENEYGILLTNSYSNKIFHNNFINNIRQASCSPTPSITSNVWDDGYPSGGNYWSDYTGNDTYSGPYQDEPGSDGIGDTSYIIDGCNMDNYPLMGMFYDFEIEWKDEKLHIEVVSNATISNLQILAILDHLPPYLPVGQPFIRFFAEDTINATKFCRVTIPRAILNGTYIVLIDLEEVPVYEIPNSNSTHAYLYFTYQHSKQEHEIIIVPEFPSTMILTLFMLTTLITTILLKREGKPKPQPLP